MRESVIHAFFEGSASVDELVRELDDARIAEEPPGLRASANYRIAPMASGATLSPEHLVRLVDAVLQGRLTHELLGTLIFCIEASDRWRWDGESPDGERVAKALFLLGTPEINYPLTPRVLTKLRTYLPTGRDEPSRADLRTDGIAAGEA